MDGPCVCVDRGKQQRKEWKKERKSSSKKKDYCFSCCCCTTTKVKRPDKIKEKWKKRKETEKWWERKKRENISKETTTTATATTTTLLAVIPNNPTGPYQRIASSWAAHAQPRPASTCWRAPLIISSPQHTQKPTSINPLHLSSSSSSSYSSSSFDFWVSSFFFFKERKKKRKCWRVVPPDCPADGQSDATFWHFFVVQGKTNSSDGWDERKSAIAKKYLSSY